MSSRSSGGDKRAAHVPDDLAPHPLERPAPVRQFRENLFGLGERRTGHEPHQQSGALARFHRARIQKIVELAVVAQQPFEILQHANFSSGALHAPTGKRAH